MSKAAARRHRGNPIERLVERWYGLDTQHAVLVLLAVLVAAWTAFHAITYAGIGLHPDLTEVYAWGRHPLAGYYKHPPLGALMCAAWFAIFPAADWAFHLLAMVNAAAALYCVDLIARRYLSGDKRLMVLLLLLLTPFYQFHAQRFASNQTLLATWPLAVYCFLRAFESRTVGWSLAAGGAVALAMLGKYYSIYLVGGIAIAALTHPKAARYLQSPSPWLSIVGGLLVMAPHLYWLQATGFQPLDYAYGVHGGTLLPVFLSLGNYLIGAVGYLGLPLALWWLVVRPTRRQLTRILWPPDPERRMLVTLFLGFFLLPPLSAPFLGVLLTSLWTMQIWFLLPIILLAPATVKLPHRAAVRTASGLLVFTVIAVFAIAPVLSWINLTHAGSGRPYYKQLSAAVMQAWHASVGSPLIIVLGDTDLAAAVTFYDPDHPDSVPYHVLSKAPWVTPERLTLEGWAAVCATEDPGCIGAAERRAIGRPRARRSTIEIVPRLFGFVGKPSRFTIFVVPPQALARDIVPRS